MPSRTRFSNRAHLALLLFGLLFIAYLLSYGGDFLSTDERTLFAAGNSLARHGSPTANQLFWEETGVVLINANGDRCANYEPAQVLLSTPLIWLARWLPRVGLVHAAFLFSAMVTAATAAVLFLYISDLGHRTSTSMITAGLFGLATIAWPYSKTFFREPLSALALLAGAWFLLRLGRSARPRDAILAGSALGLAVATKQANVLALLALVPFALSYLLKASHSTRATLSLASLAILAALLMIVPSSLYQRACGRPQLGVLTTSVSGSRPQVQVASTSAADAQPPVQVAPTSVADARPRIALFWKALAGFLFSPGKSLFIYAPVLLATWIGLPLGWRQHRREVLLSVSVFAVYLMGYAYLTPTGWWGGLCWGPRYLVPIVPIMCIPLAPVVAWVVDHPRTLRTALFGILVLVSLAVQLVGVSVSSLTYSASITQLRPDGMWTLALYNPIYSQPLYSLRLLQLSELDFSWVHTAGESTQIDWLFLALAAGVLSLMALALWRAWRHRLPRWVFPCLLLAALSLTGLLLVRRYDDPRFPGGSDYHALVEDLRQQATAGDVMVLSNSFYTDFFLNYNKASPDWYALDKAGEQLAPDVEALLGRLVSRHNRLWMVMDQTPALGLPHPEEDWLVARLYPIQETVYSDYCRLLLFSTQDLPDPARPATPLDLNLGERLRLVGYDLPSRNLRAGDALRMSLLWQARQRPEQNLTVFVQLLSPNRGLAWQADQYPVQGQRPTTTWEPGEQIRDQYGWIVPADLPPSSYRLIAGLYQSETMTRWPVTDSSGRLVGDFVELGTITIAASP